MPGVVLMRDDKLAFDALGKELRINLGVKHFVREFQLHHVCLKLGDFPAEKRKVLL